MIDRRVEEQRVPGGLEGGLHRGPVALALGVGEHLEAGVLGGEDIGLGAGPVAAAVVDDKEFVRPL